MNNVKDLQTIEETLKYLQFDNWEQSAPGLARSRELLGLLGNPEQKLKFVHIAGTNGKGSTAAMLASVLRRAGYRTGLYTSPHLLRFHERMRVNGEEIDDESLISLTNTVRNAAESMSEMPTGFEIMTAIAFLYFVQEQCDIVSLEVGLGGRMDSTNVIPAPEVCVVANIGPRSHKPHLEPACLASSVPPMHQEVRCCLRHCGRLSAKRLLPSHDVRVRACDRRASPSSSP